MYKNINAWAAIVIYTEDLPLKSPLNQKVKVEDISQFQREVFRYNAYKNPLQIFGEGLAILIGRGTKHGNMAFLCNMVLSQK